MTSEFHKSASKNGVSITAYRGDGSALLAFDIDQHLVTPLFAGFAVQAKAPDGTTEWLKNRLNLKTGLHSESTPADRQKNWTDSDQAPFQKFRWQHFPAKPQPGTWTYTVTPMFFTSQQSAKLKPGTAVSVTLDFVLSDYKNIQIGFTRSYVSSQAYAEKFKNAPIRQLPKTLDFDTSKFKDQYEFLGYTARKLLFDFLAEAAKPNVRLDVFAYDFDEPDVLKALVALGKRLRIWLDDASLHQAPALEVEVHKRLVASAGEENVKRGHFSRFAHHKVMIQRDAKTGKAIKVLTGSANFSIRGFYVQANNVLVFNDPQTADAYAQVFDEVWSEKKAATSATEFAKSKLSADWTPRTDREGLPPFDLCFSPHPKPKTGDLCSLKKVAAAIDSASSSVLFAVMQLGGGGSVMTQLSKEQAKNPDLFWYGMTQNLAAADGKKKGASAEDGDGEQTTGVTVSKPDGQQVLVPFAFLKDNVPPPFDQETDGGPGQVIHNKFVVVDFNGANPAVFTGSSNLAAGGEQQNGDNLIGIYDRSIAVMYGVEAIRLIDHFGFRAALRNAKPPKAGAKPAPKTKAAAKSQPLQLQSPGPGARWWEDYYKKRTAKFNERALFIK